VENLEKLRIDKWLWAARFYKTRKLATEAVNGGHVQVNGDRIKPARAIAIDDVLIITKGLFKFTITVLALSSKRGPAKVAKTLYQESKQSIQLREQLSEQRKNQSIAAPKRRPDKRERAKIIRFKNKFAP